MHARIKNWEICQKTLIKRNNSSVDPSSDDPYYKTQKYLTKKVNSFVLTKPFFFALGAVPEEAPVPVEKYGDVDHQLKTIRVEGMQSQVLKNRADAIKTNVDSIRSQIELMQQMENVYVRKMGQTKYDDMIVSLINQLPSMKSSIDFSDTNTSSGDPESPYRDVSSLESPF